jgi:UPF0755 protein
MDWNKIFNRFKLLFEKSKNYLGLIIFFIFTLGLIYIIYNSLPVNLNSKDKFFEIKSGDNIFSISRRLYEENLIRSKTVFNFWGILTGKALKLQTGTYKLNSNFNLFKILNSFYFGKNREVLVKIREGATMYDIDNILSENNVLKKGELIAFAKNFNLEGKLYPDTYYFFYNSKAEEVIQKILNNFNSKIGLLLKESKNPTSTLILASLLEKESYDFEDQKIIAGILLKRLEINMPLQVDATICYLKILENNSLIPCLPFNPLDFKINSPYNTYTNKGLPPTPISNPSMQAVLAALSPIKTKYLYYLSDPKTGKTIFSETLEEHNKNIIKYLK